MDVSTVQVQEVGLGGGHTEANLSRSQRSGAGAGVGDRQIELFSRIIQGIRAIAQSKWSSVGLGVCLSSFALLALSHANTKVLFDHLVAPLFYVSDPSKRTYWLYLAVSALFAVGFVFCLYIKNTKSRRENSELLNATKARSTAGQLKRWLFHGEAVFDISLLLSNSVCKGLLIIPLIGSQLALVLGFAKLLQGFLGNSPNLLVPYWLVLLSFTLLYFIAEDASRFFLHRAMHRRKFLWAFHKTHHSAKTLTPLTLFRVHPVEMFLYYLRSTFVLVSVAGTFVYLFKGKVGGFEILGVDALGFIFNLALANLRHSHLHISFGFAEKWFISPAQHQLHHSANPAHFNCNYGSALSLWDRLFKSFQESSNSERSEHSPWLTKLRFGITQRQEKTQ